MGCLGCCAAWAQEPQAEDAFYRESFAVYYPQPSVDLPDLECYYASMFPVFFTAAVKDYEFFLLEVKDCKVVDAKGRDLQARVDGCDDYSFRIETEDDIYPQGDWVDVQAVATVVKLAGLCREDLEVSASESGELQLKHGHLAWNIGTDEYWGLVLHLNPGKGIGRVHSISYTDADGNNEFLSVRDNTVYLDSPIPAGVKWTVEYFPAAGIADIPFRYRLTMSGAEHMPYVPDMPAAKTAPVEDELLPLNPAEHPVVPYFNCFSWSDDGEKYEFELGARMYSDTQSIANAKVKDVLVQDETGVSLSVGDATVVTTHDSAEVKITCPQTLRGTVTVSGMLELGVGATADRQQAVLVPCEPGSAFSVGEWEGTVEAMEPENQEVYLRMVGNQEVEGEPQVVRIHFKDIPEDARTEDVKLTADNSKSHMLLSVHKGFQQLVAEFTPEMEDDKLFKQHYVYTAVFDGPIKHVKVTVDSRKGAQTRRVPFSFNVNIGGAQPQ